MLPLLFIALCTSPATVDVQVPDLSGYYTLSTEIVGEPARLAVRLARTGNTYSAEVYPAMGPGPVNADEVIVKQNRATISTTVHEMTLRLELEFHGETVTGRWITPGDEGQITGKRDKDPKSS
jgi:hypothetical protein